MTSLEILKRLSKSPSNPNELANPVAIAKMQLAKWIHFDHATKLWHITAKGELALLKAESDKAAK